MQGNLRNSGSVDKQQLKIYFDFMNSLAKQTLGTQEYSLDLERIEGVEGGLEIYNYCKSIWKLIDMDLNSTDTYRKKLVSLISDINEFVNQKGSDAQFKEFFIGFFLQSFVDLLKPKKSVLNKKLMNQIKLLFKNLINFSIDIQSFKLMTTIAEQVNVFESFFKHQVTKGRLLTSCGFDEYLGSFREELISNLLKFDFSEIEEDLSEVNAINFVYCLNEKNIYTLGGSLISSILNLKSNFIDTPVYMDTTNLKKLYQSKLNWDFFISKISQSIGFEVVKCQQGFVQVNEKLNKIEEEIELEFQQYMEMLLKKTTENNQHVKLKALNSVLSMKLNCVGQIKKDILEKKKSLSENSNYSDKIERLSGELDLLQLQHKVEKNIYDQFERRRAFILKQKGELKQRLDSESQTDSKELEKVNKEIIYLESRYKHLNKDAAAKMVSLNRAIEQKKTDKGRINAEIKAEQNKVYSAKKKLSRIQKQKRLEDEELRALEYKFSNLKISNANLSSEIYNVQVLNEDLKKQIGILEQECQKLFAQIKEKDSIYHLKRFNFFKQRLEALKFESLNIQFQDENVRQKYLGQMASQRLSLIHQNNHDEMVCAEKQSTIESLNGQLTWLHSMSLRNGQKFRCNKEYLKSKSTSLQIHLSDFEKKLLIELSSDINISAYFCGGRVRDGILGILSRDLDIVVFVPEHLEKKLFSKNGYSQSPYKANLYQKKVFFNNQYFEIDVSAYRPSEIKDYFNKPFLRINALLADVRGVVYDAHRGIEELTKPTQYRYIEVVGEIYERIQKDPFRILRMIGTSARLSKGIRDEHWEAFSYNGKKINKLPLGKYLSGLDKLLGHTKGDIALCAVLMHPRFLLQMLPCLEQVKHNLSMFQQYMIKKIVDIHREQYLQAHSNVYLNNAYLAVMLIPLMSAYNTLDNPSKAKIVSQIFWDKFKGDLGPNYLKEKVNQNLIKYLTTFANELNPVPTKKPYMSRRMHT